MSQHRNILSQKIEPHKSGSSKKKDHKRSTHNFFQLPIAKKTVSILEGKHPSVHKGNGRDFADLRFYVPGDNIKHIDWKASAKAGQIVMKEFQANANTNLNFLIDSGRVLYSRAVSGEKKIDILKEVCKTFSRNSTNRLDGVSIIAGDESRLLNEKVRFHYGEINSSLNKLPKIFSPDSPNSSFLRVLKYARQYLHRRSLIVLVFDESSFFEDQEEKFLQILKLKSTHDIFAVSIKSPNPFSNDLNKITGKTIDIASHNFIPAYFRNDELIKSVKKEMSKQRSSIRSLFKRANIPLICIDGIENFYYKLNKILSRSEVKHY